MINEEKIKLMTRIQLFQKHEKEAVKVNRFFQKDYLGLYMIRSLISYVVLYVLIIGIIVLYNWESLLETLNLEALVQTGWFLLLIFILLMIPSMVISYIAYWFRYRRCRKKMKEYILDLKQLNAFYQKGENDDRESAEQTAERQGKT